MVGLNDLRSVVAKKLSRFSDNLIDVIIFRANAKFFGLKPTAQNDFLVFIKVKKRHSLQRDEVPESGISANIIGWGESRKVILQISNFSGAVEIFFGKDCSAQPPPPIKKLARTPMDNLDCV